MPTRALPVWRDRGAADDAGEAFDAAHDSNSASTRQVLDVDGHRLPPNRHALLIQGGPRLARPSWYRLASDRWLEAVAP